MRRDPNTCTWSWPQQHTDILLKNIRRDHYLLGHAATWTSWRLHYYHWVFRLNWIKIGERKILFQLRLAPSNSANQLHMQYSKHWHCAVPCSRQEDDFHINSLHLIFYWTFSVENTPQKAYYHPNLNNMTWPGTLVVDPQLRLHRWMTPTEPLSTLNILSILVPLTLKLGSIISTAQLLLS